jgi:hypothetical protein
VPLAMAAPKAGHHAILVRKMCKRKILNKKVYRIYFSIQIFTIFSLQHIGEA